MDISDIIYAITSDSELSRILTMIEDFAIIEYDGNVIDGSRAIAQYMDENDLERTNVKRIILLGKKTQKKIENELILSELYPNATITVVNKLWTDIDPGILKVWHTFVFHIGISVGITEYMFDKKSDKGKDMVNFINKTRVAYYACLVYNDEPFFLDNQYIFRYNLRLREFAFETNGSINNKTDFCREKQEYINSCINTLTSKDAFFQCIDESEHGCEECNQCGKYGAKKHCPFALRAVANFYREGIYVPKDEKIAHQWELMAARQEYKPSCIQIADDLKTGFGCKKNINDALAIYSSYASQIGNDYCIHQILDIAEHESEIKRIIAIPFIAQQAQDGNEDMIIKLSDAFQNAEYGLPKDMDQQKEWIQQGAENGNPRFMLAMAEMYESNSDWQNAYTWYKSLEDTASELVSEEKIEEIELKMLTNGATPKEVAITGQNYLFGYFGKERDLHLAFRCLKYASDNNIPMAKGLLGYMYTKGLHIDENLDLGIELLTSAAENGDLFSMDKLTDIHYDSDTEYVNGYHWENILIDKIEEEIAVKKPFAYYLKGHYQRLGYLYSEDEFEAFENLKIAADLSNPIAQYELSEMYDNGIGCDYDASEAKLWLKKSAENGYYKAEGKYGIELFGNHTWFNPTRNRSFVFLKHAYEQGYDEAYWYIAKCYMYGYGTNVNKNIAYPLYQKAAENGVMDAQVFLCQKYFKGDYPLPKDYKLCAKWGEEALKQGCKSVRFETAYSLSHTGNHSRAKELYLELANEGNTVAMNNYGCELDDPKESAIWFHTAADNGDSYGQWNIARYYKNGTGVEKDIDKAIEYFKKSAEQGTSGAMLDLAKMYRYGDGVDISGITAIEWYKKAADNDEIDAILAIAEIYSEGQIILQDIEIAIHYYKMAAEKGNSTALYKLGELYENGTGVEQNINKAIYWYRKAAIKNNYSAKSALKRLNTNWLGEDGNTVDPEDFDDDLIF